MWLKQSFGFCIIVSALQLSDAASFSDSNTLYTNITRTYNKNIRPHADSSDPTFIFMSFSPVSLQQINEVDGTVSMTGYFTIMWKDHSLTWDPNDHGGLNYIVVPQESIWIPTLLNSNTAKDFKMFGTTGLVTIINADGTIVWLPGENLIFSCDIDTSYFPFDTQECKFVVLTWGHPTGDIILNSTASVAETGVYAKNAEWDLVKTKIVTESGSQPNTIDFIFFFKRRPVFLLATLVIPMLFMALLNIAVFLLPQESGERVGFSITLLLAVVVFLTIAQGLLPAISTPRLSSICIVLMLDLMMSGMILVSVIISARIYYTMPKKKIPTWLKLVVHDLSCCSGSKKNQIGDLKPATDESYQTKVQHMDDEVEWTDIALFFDRLSIMFYLIMFIGGNMFYFIDIAIGMNKD